MCVCVCVILIFSLFLFNYLCTYVMFQLFPHGKLDQDWKRVELFGNGNLFLTQFIGKKNITWLPIKFE